jgi:hypothetical protein
VIDVGFGRQNHGSIPAIVMKGAESLILLDVRTNPQIRLDCPVSRIVITKNKFESCYENSTFF